MNKANYTSWVDPDGGEWILMTGTKFKGTTWRPAELGMDETGNIKFSLDFFQGPEATIPEGEDYEKFGRMCGKILTEIIANEVKDLEQIKEITEKQEEEPKIIV